MDELRHCRIWLVSTCRNAIEYTCLSVRAVPVSVSEFGWYFNAFLVEIFLRWHWQIYISPMLVLNMSISNKSFIAQRTWFRFQYINEALSFSRCRLSFMFWFFINSLSSFRLEFVFFFLSLRAINYIDVIFLSFFFCSLFCRLNFLRRTHTSA